MASQGRRKHSACLFRMRENCPFRRLKRNMCSDSRSALVPAGGQWSSREASPQAGSSTSRGAVSGETCSRPPPRSQQFPAMDTDMEPVTGSSHTVSDAPGPSNFSHINQQCQRNTDTIMDLDSGVDPETGERAQG